LPSATAAQQQSWRPPQRPQPHPNSQPTQHSSQRQAQSMRKYVEKASRRGWSSNDSEDEENGMGMPSLPCSPFRPSVRPSAAGPRLTQHHYSLFFVTAVRPASSHTLTHIVQMYNQKDGRIHPPLHPLAESSSPVHQFTAGLFPRSRGENVQTCRHNLVAQCCGKKWVNPAAADPPPKIGQICSQTNFHLVPSLIIHPPS
jgi:hypothetical protein